MKKSILIVEDRPEIRSFIALALRNLPLLLVEAGSGEDGVVLARKCHPDLILLDVMMPGILDGLSTLRAIRSDPELALTPVVMVSALAQERDIADAMNAGANDYITKPFSIARLREVIKCHVGID